MPCHQKTTDDNCSNIGWSVPQHMPDEENSPEAAGPIRALPAGWQVVGAKTTVLAIILADVFKADINILGYIRWLGFHQNLFVV